jgi:hypothetical protein
MPCQQLNAVPAPRERCHRPGVAHQLHARDGVQGSGVITAISTRDAAFQPLAALSRAHRAGLRQADMPTECPRAGSAVS